MIDQICNHLGQPIGPPVPGWTPARRPERTPLVGRTVRLEPLAEHHTEELFEANAADREDRLWTYFTYGPWPKLDEYAAWVRQASASTDPLWFAIIAGGRASGVAAYQRIDMANGSIEVGHLVFAPRLQRTTAATEAMVLMMAHAFELGFRRYEWKCDVLNAPSRQAALRLGFTFEGVFRQSAVARGHNRDTAWFSVLDREWPRLRDACARWLDPANFDAGGRQRLPLAACAQRPAATNSSR